MVEGYHRGRATGVCLAQESSAEARYSLWLIAFVKFLIPFVTFG
jgi:hypothetical protein